MTMDVDNYLPFKVGQQVECKSFEQGYRGAWFRSKIKKISSRRGQIGYHLEFFDFPDEKIRWTKLYEVAPRDHNLSGGEGTLELMVRPSFPSFYHKSQLPDSSPISDLMVVVDDMWKVGDLVDWWCNSCYWSGRVIDVLGDDKVQIKLPDPPIGEGDDYEAFCKDLRPSLNWSLEHGWTVPISREFGNYQHCARLVQLCNQDRERSENHTLAVAESTIDPESSMGVKLESDDTRRPTPNSFSKGSSSHNNTKDSLGVAAKVSSGRGLYESANCLQKILSGEREYVTPVRHADTIESSIMELEELANKIKWLKGFVQFGFRWSNAMKPSWKLLEDQGSKEP